MTYHTFRRYSRTNQVPASGRRWGGLWKSIPGTLSEVRLIVLFSCREVHMALASTFLQQTFSTGYPKLLRLFHEFFAKIAVHTDTVYTHSFQRYLSRPVDVLPSLDIHK